MRAHCFSFVVISSHHPIPLVPQCTIYSVVRPTTGHDCPSSNRLSSNQRLVLVPQRIHGRSNRRSSEVLLGSSREIFRPIGRSIGHFLLDLGFGSRSGGLGVGWGSAADVGDHFGGLVRIVTNILLRCGCSSSHVVACNCFHLLSLLVDNVGCISDVLVDELLVGLVDEGCEEDDSRSDQAETPYRNELDQVVGNE